jgi:hypothetical protein
MANKEWNDVIKILTSYRWEARQAREERMRRNVKNFDFYNLKQDMTHKRKGQSQDFLPKQAMAVEQTTAFLHQGLVDLGDWFKVESEPGVKAPLFTDGEAKLIMENALRKAKFYNFMADSIKAGYLGSIMIAKVGSETVNKPRYFTRRKPKSKELKLMKKDRLSNQVKIELVRQRDFFPDPTGRGLYKIQRIEMDLHDLISEAQAAPDVYNLKVIEQLRTSIEEKEKAKEAAETNQNVVISHARKVVTVYEFWGSIQDPITGRLIYKDVVCAWAEDKWMIREPEAFPTWDGKAPFVIAPLLRQPWSVWHKALADASTELNQALNEMFNLIQDSGIQAIFGLKQYREHWMADPSQAQDGFVPGASIAANHACPVGAKVVEPVDTRNINSSDGINAFNLTNSEFQQASLSNDLRMGVLPSRAVKATEVVESSQSINSVFNDVAKNLEEFYVEPNLERVWSTEMQIMNSVDLEELKALLGPDRVKELKAIPKKERWARTVNGFKFKVFGITRTLNKLQEFRKIATLLQTISADETLLEEFARKYDFSKLLEVLMESLDINLDRIRLDKADAAVVALSEQGGAAPIQPGATGPDMQSQIPQAGGENMRAEEPSTGAEGGELS